MKASIFLEKWWAGRKWPAYGYYSQNVMKVTKAAGDHITKAADVATKHAGDAIKKLHEKVLKRPPKHK